MDIRRGVTVIPGCLMLFGAPGIVAGLRGALPDMDTDDRVHPVATLAPALVPTSTPTPSAGYDRYAGASVPFG